MAYPNVQLDPGGGYKVVVSPTELISCPDLDMVRSVLTERGEDPKKVETLIGFLEATGHQRRR